MVAELLAVPARARRIAWLVMLMSITTPAVGAETQSADAEARGRSLYLTGVRTDGRPLTAHNEGTGLTLPQAFVACVNCHGYEARGGSEAGTVASDIRWETLTRPYELARTDGRRRAPYDGAAFFAALSKGRDPSGHALDSAMPRFAVSAADADDLRAYLQQLAKPSDQGVSDDTLRIGIVSSQDAADGASAESNRRLLACWFGELNDKGGIFRRRIELVPVAAGSMDSARSVLALLAIDGSDNHSPEFDVLPGIPLLSAVADSTTDNDRYRFALYPGVVARARTLALYSIARDPAPQPQLALLYPERTISPALLASVVSALEPLATVKSIPIAATRSDETADALRDEGVHNALILGTGDAVDALVARAPRHEWDPLFLWIERPGNDAAGVRAVTVEPALVNDVTAEAGASYARCVDVAATNASDRARQLALLASARLLVTALEQGGRDISRERLVETLQGLREFRSDFAPPGSLTPQRHTAASGVYVVPLPASRFQPDPVWMMLD
jgi:mono/diheme cytochrome c family protein